MDFNLFPTFLRPHRLIGVAADDSGTVERFAGVVIGGLSVFAVFVLALVYLLRRYRKGTPRLPDTEILHSTPLEWEPSAPSACNRNIITCGHGSQCYSEWPTPSSLTRSACPCRDPTAFQPFCRACFATQKSWRPPTVRTDGTISEDCQFRVMGAYHDDDYDPSKAKPPDSRTNTRSSHNRSDQPFDGAAGEISASVLPMCTHIRNSVDLAVHETAPGQDYVTQPLSHGITSPDSSGSTHRPTSKNGKPKDIAGRLSVILKSLDSLVEEMQEETELAGMTSLQRLKEGLEVIRGDPGALQGALQAKRISRRASDAPVMGFAERHQSTSRAPGISRQINSVGDGGITQPWVMT